MQLYRPTYEQTYSLSDAARILQYASRNSLWAAANSGRIPYAVLDGYLRFDCELIEYYALRRHTSVSLTQLARRMHLHPCTIDWHIKRDRFDTLFHPFRGRLMDPIEADDFAAWYQNDSYYTRRYPGIVERYRSGGLGGRPNNVIAREILAAWLEPADTIASVWELWDEIKPIAWVGKIEFVSMLVSVHNGTFHGRDNNDRQGYYLQAKAKSDETK